MNPSHYTVGLPEDGRVPSKTTRIQPPGGLSHINHDMLPESDDAKNCSRVLKPPGGGSSSDSIFSSVSSTGGSSASSIISSPNESRASSTSPKTPAKKYHMKSNFELGDEQPETPIQPKQRKPYVPPVNPVTGEPLGSQGFNEIAEPSKPARRPNRIPPGGYATPLW